MKLVVAEHFPDQVAHLKTGDKLPLWTVPDLDCINAYRPGTSFGEGLTLRLLKSDNPWLADQMHAGLGAWLHVDAFDGKHLSITAHAETDEDAIAAIKTARERYRKAISAPLKKLSEMKVEIAARVPSLLVQGWMLPFIPEPVDYYVNNTWAVPQFVIPKTMSVAWIRKPSSACIAVLQAHFHGLQITLQITGSSRVVPSGNRYSHWEEVVAPGMLSFEHPSPKPTK